MEVLRKSQMMHEERPSPLLIADWPHEQQIAFGKFRVDLTCLLVRWWQKSSRTQPGDKDSIAATRLSESPMILQPASIQLPASVERGGNPSFGVYLEMVSQLLSGLHVLHQEVTLAFL